MYHLVCFGNLVAQRLIVCSTNLMVTHLFHSELLSKAFGSRQSEQTDSSQPAEADIQPNAGVEQSSSQPTADAEQSSNQPASPSNTAVEQSSSQLGQAASQSNTGVEEQRSSQLGQPASQPNTGVEKNSSQLEGAHNDPVASVEQSSSEKEMYRLGASIHEC